MAAIVGRVDLNGAGRIMGCASQIVVRLLHVPKTTEFDTHDNSQKTRRLTAPTKSGETSSGNFK
jgi:hypothetical protein